VICVPNILLQQQDQHRRLDLLVPHKLVFVLNENETNRVTRIEDSDNIWLFPCYREESPLYKYLFIYPISPMTEREPLCHVIYLCSAAKCIPGVPNQLLNEVTDEMISSKTTKFMLLSRQTEHRSFCAISLIIFI